MKNSNNISEYDRDNYNSYIRYRRRLDKYNISPETLGWRRGTQEIRFQSFAGGFLGKPPESILDVGCGFGDLLGFLRARGWQGKYLGIDLMPEFIAIAKEKFSHEEDDRSSFICSDFMVKDFERRFDACFASGILNHIRLTGNYDFLDSFLDKIKEINTTYCAVDMLSSMADRRASELFFYDPTEVLKIATCKSRRLVIDHSYMPFEFMLKIYWQDGFPDGVPVFEEL